MGLSHKDSGRRAGWAVDPDAFEVFYREHLRAVEGFVARRVGDRERAADLTADVFVAAVDAAGSYRPELGSEIAWLFGIARYLVSDEAERERRDRELVQRISGRELLAEDETYGIDERLVAEASRRALYGAIGHLPPGERAVLELVALDELSVADAARVLGIRAVTARVRLLRARRQLAVRLRASTETETPPARVRPREVG